MKKRTSIAVVAVAAIASWLLPGAQRPADHEFLVQAAQADTAPSAVATQVEPVQLALLFQLHGR